MLSPSAARVLHLLHHHRLLTTSMVHEMVTPHTKRTQAVWQVLTHLRRAGLADCVGRRGARLPSLWFTTEEGADVVEASNDVPGRPYQMDVHRATGPLQQHTLAVAETGLAFLRNARRRGDDVGPLDWSPEIAHRFRSGAGPFEDSHVIADALLNYLRVDGKRRSQLQFFIEVDRATMPLPRLAAKVVRYAFYYDYTPDPLNGPTGRHRTAQRKPLWQRRYNRFPRILIVFTGGREVRLQDRIYDLAGRLQETPYLSADRPQFQVGGVTMDQLRRHGPTAHIFVPLLDPHRGLTDFRLGTSRTNTPR